jgi:hypothetical protein
MRMGLVEIPEEIIKSLPVRDTRRARFSQSPLADQSRSIARLLENLRHGDIPGSQRIAAVAPDDGPAGMQSGHQRAARRGADRAACVVLSKPDTFSGHAVQVGRADLLLPVAARISVPQIVSQNINDVGLRRNRPDCLTMSTAGRQNNRQQEHALDSLVHYFAAPS